MKHLIFIFCFLSLAFSATYDVGDVVSLTHQNIVKETCFPGNGYSNGSSWKLADWNGAENGGQWNVIFIDMSASW